MGLWSVGRRTATSIASGFFETPLVRHAMYSYARYYSFKYYLIGSTLLIFDHTQVVHVANASGGAVYISEAGSVVITSPLPRGETLAHAQLLSADRRRR